MYSSKSVPDALPNLLKPTYITAVPHIYQAMPLKTHTYSSKSAPDLVQHIAAGTLEASTNTPKILKPTCIAARAYHMLVNTS